VAYLKAHHPADYMAAVLSHSGGFYGQRAYLSECARLGLRVLPPDVNASELEYMAEGVDSRQQAVGGQSVAAASLPPDLDSGIRGRGFGGKGTGTGKGEQD